MSKGFTTFVNSSPQFLGLLEVLIDSVLNFTSYDIEVFGINFEYKHPNKRVRTQRLDFNGESFLDICYNKIVAATKSSFDLSMHLDADMIITKDIEKIFDFKNQIDRYILCPLHENDHNYLKFNKLEPMNGENQLMEILNIPSKTQPYVHADTFLYNKNSIAFLESVLDLINFCKKNNIFLYAQDETAINVLLWKSQQNSKYLESYDGHFHHFEDCSTNQKYLIAHGCKNPEQARNIYNKLLKGYTHESKY
jgi:hypothetical protein